MLYSDQNLTFVVGSLRSNCSSWIWIGHRHIPAIRAGWVYSWYKHDAYAAYWMFVLARFGDKFFRHFYSRHWLVERFCFFLCLLLAAVKQLKETVSSSIHKLANFDGKSSPRLRQISLLIWSRPLIFICACVCRSDGRTPAEQPDSRRHPGQPWSTQK